MVNNVYFKLFLATLGVVSFSGPVDCVKLRWALMGFPRITKSIQVGFSNVAQKRFFNSDYQTLNLVRGRKLLSSVRAVFSRNESIADNLSKTMSCAHKSIKIAVYYFTNSDLAHHLVKLSRENPDLKIEVVVHHQSCSNRYEACKILRNAGIPVFCYKPKNGKSFMHHKFMIVDETSCFIGSYNFSQSAEHCHREAAFF